MGKWVLVLYIVSLSNGAGAIVTVEDFTSKETCEIAGKQWDDRLYAMWHECIEVK